MTAVTLAARPAAGLTASVSPRPVFCPVLIDDARAFHVEVLRATVAAAGGQVVDPALTLLGCSWTDLPAALAERERTHRRSIRCMQLRVPFVLRTSYAAMNRSAIARGVTLELIVAPLAVHANPLLSTIMPTARIAFVAMPLIVVDDMAAIVPGPTNDVGDATAWMIRNGELVARARDLWERSWASSRPVSSGRPPLTERQYAVACMIVDGASDAQIAHRLHISARTVCNDITAARRLVNATSRSDLISKLMTHES